MRSLFINVRLLVYRVSLCRFIALWHLAATLSHLIAVVVASLLRLVALEVALRRMAIVATHSVHSREIDIYLATSHNVNIANDGAIVGVLVIKLKALGAHIACYVEHLGSLKLRIMLCRDGTHKLHNILTIVLERYARLWIWQLSGYHSQVLA